MKQAEAAGVERPAAREAALDRLTTSEEVAVIKRLAVYSDTVDEAARLCEPHRVVFYLIDLAADFHRFYNRHRVLTDDRQVSQARLYLAWAVGEVVRQGLELLGVRAPEEM